MEEILNNLILMDDTCKKKLNELKSISYDIEELGLKRGINSKLI